MALLDQTLGAISEVNHDAAAITQRLLDGKTKPRRSLGRLEDLACKVAAIQVNPRPPLPTKAMVVMAGPRVKFWVPFAIRRETTPGMDSAGPFTPMSTTTSLAPAWRARTLMAAPPRAKLSSICHVTSDG